MAIEAVAGKSKNTEFWIYVSLLFVTVMLINADPTLIERL